MDIGFKLIATGIVLLIFSAPFVGHDREDEVIPLIASVMTVAGLTCALVGVLTMIWSA